MLRNINVANCAKLLITALAASQGLEFFGSEEIFDHECFLFSGTLCPTVISLWRFYSIRANYSRVSLPQEDRAMLDKYSKR